MATLITQQGIEDRFFRLYRFLSSAFNNAELRAFFAEHYPALLTDLPQGGSERTSAYVAARLLEDHNHIDAELFSRLRELRPQRGAEIDSLMPTDSAASALKQLSLLFEQLNPPRSSDVLSPEEYILYIHRRVANRDADFIDRFRKELYDEARTHKVIVHVFSEEGEPEVICIGQLEKDAMEQLLQRALDAAGGSSVELLPARQE